MSVAPAANRAERVLFNEAFDDGVKRGFYEAATGVHAERICNNRLCWSGLGRDCPVVNVNRGQGRYYSCQHHRRKNSYSTSGLTPAMMSANARAEPGPSVQPNVPWPVFK